MKHSNVAIFVPHNGCPHNCSFCNQREITGQQSQPCVNDVKNAITVARESLKENTKNAEIAFFGGSFTAIDKAYMESLLSAAAPVVKSGEFAGIRISTRPDAIDGEILETLHKYGVTAIELGAQSMNDEVLAANERGHTRADIINSSRMISEYGFSLGLQMMTGLYKSNEESDRQSAHEIADLNPDTVRIYPTVVIRGTELYNLYKSKKYIPQTLEDAVKLCSELLLYFENRDIPVVRLGLHDSESLRDGMAAGAFHPAFRELCESEIMYENCIKELEKSGIHSGTIEVYVNPRSVSRFVGQKRRNIDRLNQLGFNVIVRQEMRLERYEVRLRQVI